MRTGTRLDGSYWVIAAHGMLVMCVLVVLVAATAGRIELEEFEGRW
jgi:hypothetical protein